MPRMIRDAGDVVRMMRLLRLRLTRVIRDRHVGDVPPPSLLLRSPVWVGDVEIPPQSLLLLLRWPVWVGDVEIPQPSLLLLRWPVWVGDVEIPLPSLLLLLRWPVWVGDVDIPVTLNGLNAPVLMMMVYADGL